MENFNSFEYSAEQKCEGKWAVYKLLLILGYIVFAATYFVIIFITKMIPLGALIPFFLWILVFLTWRYISPDYQYTIEAGTFSFYINYSNKKKTKLPKTSFKISDAQQILPVSEACEAVKEFSPEKVFTGIPTKQATDVYVVLYRDCDGKKCALYFVATNDTLRLLKIHNSAALKK